MLKAYAITKGALRPLEHPDGSVELAGAAWIDLWEPTPEDIAKVRRLTSADIALPDDPDRFYVSDQVNVSNGQLTLKALLLASVEERQPRLVPVTIVRAGKTTVTVSKGSPNGLEWLIAECQSEIPGTAGGVFHAILDMVVDHATNVLDRVGADLDQTNRRLFQHRASAKRRSLILSSPRRRTAQLEAILTELGYLREVLVKLRRSMLSFRRLVGLLEERVKEEALAGKLRGFEHELSAVMEAQTDLSNGATFMLDAAVGFITILQSKTINLMTVVGILLTPPLLIASVYGMNFKLMPELEWLWGYPFALGLMVISTLMVFLIVRLRGWL